MVFSNDSLHFLKIKNFFCWIHGQNYLVALTTTAKRLPIQVKNLISERQMLSLQLTNSTLIGFSMYS